MDRETAVNIVQPHLSAVRFEHTLRVADTALMLADDHQAPRRQVEQAALLHDYAKARTLEEMKRWIETTPALPKDLLNYHPEMWHAPVGAHMLALEHGITDRDVLSAIYYHTTGRAHMTLLDMIVFIADYTEPGRQFPGIDEVRTVSRTDIVQACWLALRNTIVFLTEKQSQIYPDTFYAYNDLIVKGDR